MSDFIVNESNFIIEDDLYNSSFVPEGFTLPDGISFGEKIDDAPSWQLYSSEDLRYELLVVKEELAEKWVESHMLSPSVLMPMDLNGSVFYLLINPASHHLRRVTTIRFDGSMRFAFSFFSALQHTRTLDPQTSLRDGLFCELYSVILPCYSLGPPVADRALLKNALRGKNEDESLLTPEQMGGNGGVAYASFIRELKEHGYNVSDEQPLLTSGEPIDEFFSGSMAKGHIITGPLIIQRQYQLYDTSSSFYVLLIDKLWGEALLHTSLLSRIALNTVPLNGQATYVITMPKREPLEALDDTHFGYDKYSMMDLAQAVRRTRELVKKCDMKRGLYCGKLGVIFPVKFNDDTHDDGKLMWDIVLKGPFASAPLMQDIAYDILSVARSED